MNFRNLKYIFPLCLILTTAFFVNGCEKNDDDNNSPLPPSGNTLKTTVVGKITDTNGMVVIGALVKLGTQSTTTNGRGYFFFTNADVPKDRMVFIATKAGFFKCVHGTRTQKNEANYVNMVMQALPTAVNVDGNNGGVVSLTAGASITFPQTAFKDKNGNLYTGNVKVYARHINPADPEFESLVPGGDMLAVNSQGQARILYSLGMIEVVLMDDTGLNELNLAAGKTAELKMPIDPSQSASALNTIPLWYLNEQTAKWMEEGQATKSGSFYIGTVSHFSTWNCDYVGERTDLKGTVVDCAGNPVPNIVVTIDGFLNITTDNNGSFSTWVPVGYTIDCQVLQSWNTSLTASSPIQTITSIGGIVNIVPPLVIPCATRITGIVKNCGGASNAQAYIYATWNGGVDCVFTSDGTYQLMIPANTEINITASFFGVSGNKTITTGIIGSQDSVGVIQLCNALPVYQNKFTIVNGSNSTTYVLSVGGTLTNFVDSNSDGVFEGGIVSIFGVVNPGTYECNINFNLFNVGSSEFPLHQTSIDPSSVFIQIDTITYTSGMTSSTTTDNMLRIADFGTPGGIMSGTFEFDAPNGNIQNAEFSIIRSE